MRQHDTRSFWFEGPLNIYNTKADYAAGRNHTDIDLTVVANGRVRMCEVKQSGRGFRKPEDLAKRLRRLRPDVATIAIMQPLTPSIQAKYDRFASALQGSGVQPELITFDAEWDLQNRAFLGKLESMRMSFGGVG